MKIAVLGAGSVGCYAGGALLAAGGDVVLIGRARMKARLAEFGITLTDLSGRHVYLAPAMVRFTEDAAGMAAADMIVVTVKSADTDAAAALIAAHADDSAVVVSLQNGVGNVQRLRMALPGRTVLAGMVPFNVMQLESGRLHRGTAGELMIEASTALEPWLSLFAAAGMPLQQRADFDAIQWGKLLVNLNNSINALAGVPLKVQFSQRSYRACLAALIDEGRAVLQAAGIKPAKALLLGPKILPHVLRLPDVLFRRVAAPMLKIDPEARSSMWEDLEAGRRTEIDYLNGAIVALAASVGRTAPRNQRMVTLVRAAEHGARAPIPGDRLYQMIKGQ